jgi:hypothetical protein
VAGGAGETAAFDATGETAALGGVGEGGASAAVLDSAAAAATGASAAFGLDAGTAGVGGSAALGLDAGTTGVGGSAAFGLDAGTAAGAGAVVASAEGEGVSVVLGVAGVPSVIFTLGAGAAFGTVRGTAAPGRGVPCGFAPSFGSSVHGSGRFGSTGESLPAVAPASCLAGSGVCFATDVASGVVVGDAAAPLFTSGAGFADVGSGVPTALRVAGF